MSVYTRTIQYYETDMMGITHHANYLHLMEEARIALLEELGYSYQRMEQEGIVSPVTAVNCKYLAQTTFNDRITVETKITAFNGVILKVSYDMCKDDGTQVFTATSEHAFLDRNGRFIRLKRDYPAFYELLNRQLAQSEQTTNTQ